MIKLKHAHFHHFRSLRDVRVDFSTSDAKPLTVIRAANATAKTTFLYGLTWALFGDWGLPEPPRRRDHYRLSPLGWDVDRSGSEVQIEVEVGFSAIDEQTGLHKDYLLIREGSEIIVGESWKPQPTNLVLIEQSARGDHQVKDPDRILDTVLLPLAKKDIFFVDGDARVKDYVDNDDSQSRENVENAVRHLLALDIVESARGHVDSVLSEKLSQARREAAGTETADVAGRLLEVQQKLEKERERKADADRDLRTAKLDKTKAEQARDNALVAGGGDAEKLQADLAAARLAEQIAIKNQSKAALDMRRFINAHEAYEFLARDAIADADRVYEQLRRERKIPNVMPGMIRQRLHEGVCICGADLSPGTPGHEHLSSELEQVSRHNENRAALGALAERAKTALQARMWGEGARLAFGAWVAAGVTAEQEANRITSLDHEVKRRAHSYKELNVANQNLGLAKEAELENSKQAIRLANKVQELEVEERELKAQYDKLTKRDGSVRRLSTQQRAAEDVRAVLDHAISVLLGETIDDVSERLNQLFMSMIAMTPEASASHGVVRNVALTRGCHIRISGPRGEDLRPRTDISGAQQQALTVALIMALIEVSGDASPMVIDTPLGMTSGAVRTHFLSETLGLAHLQNRTEDSAEITPQRVLLMTPDEIKGVEDLLEQAAGQRLTLTNSQHYPDQLVNDPGTEEIEVLVCGCGPRLTDYCSICQRIDWN